MEFFIHLIMLTCIMTCIHNIDWHVIRSKDKEEDTDTLFIYSTSVGGMSHCSLLQELKLLSPRSWLKGLKPFSSPWGILCASTRVRKDRHIGEFPAILSHSWLRLRLLSHLLRTQQAVSQGGNFPPNSQAGRRMPTSQRLLLLSSGLIPPYSPSNCSWYLSVLPSGTTFLSR